MCPSAPVPQLMVISCKLTASLSKKTSEMRTKTHEHTKSNGKKRNMTNLTVLSLSLLAVSSICPTEIPSQTTL